MRILLLTTTDLKAKRDADLAVMLGSVEQEVKNGANISLRLLVQNCSDESFSQFKSKLPPFVSVEAITSRVSLSLARNRLLNSLEEQDFEPDTIIAFPDDDCWYPANFLFRLEELFLSRETADLFVCGFGSRPIKWDSALAPALATTVRIIRTTSSNNMFFRGSVLRSVREFDERLGLGAQFNGGEDTDFVIRAFLNSREAYVSPEPLVGHPDKNLNTVAKYYCGTTLAIAKHATKTPALFYQFIRKIMVGVVLLCRKKISIREFAPSIQEVWQNMAFRQPAEKSKASLEYIR